MSFQSNTLSRSVFVLPLVAAAALLTCGCLVSGQSTMSRSGNYVSPKDQSYISSHQDMTRDDVVKRIGEADSHNENCTEFRYEYTERHESSAKVFLLFDGRNERESHHRVIIRFNDRGTVQSVSRH